MTKKCKFFIWSLLHGCIKTIEKLQKRLPQWCLNPNWCVLCKTHLEIIDHIFTTCDAAIFIWKKIENLLNWEHDNTSIADFCEHIRHINQKKQKRIHLVQHDCHFSLWSIWLERNNQIFSNKA